MDKGIMQRASEILTAGGHKADLSPQAQAVCQATEERFSGIQEQLAAIMAKLNQSYPTKAMPRPKLEEIKLRGKEIGLPDCECEKFFHYYEMIGWKVNKVPMKLWTSALTGWRNRWQERNGHAADNGMTSAERVQLNQELARAQKRRETIRGAYSGMMEWDEGDRMEYNRLGLRVKELKLKLGITV